MEIVNAKDRFRLGGYVVYPRGEDGSQSLLFNKVIGNVGDVTYKDNYNKTTLRTFGKYPSIYYVGETNYKTFSLQGVFTSSDECMYETEDSLSDITLVIKRDSTCDFRSGTVLILTDKDFNIKLFYRPYTPFSNGLRISSNLQGLQITGNISEVRVRATAQVDQTYYLFWYNCHSGTAGGSTTQPNNHTCKHVVISSINARTGLSHEYAACNYNQPVMNRSTKNLYNYDPPVDSPLDTRIYDYTSSSNRIQTDNNGLKIYPIFILNNSRNFMSTLEYIYQENVLSGTNGSPINVGQVSPVLKPGAADVNFENIAMPESGTSMCAIDTINWTAYEQYMAFKRLIEQRIPWVIRSSVSGEDFICDIEIMSTMHNHNSIIKKGGRRQTQRETCEYDERHVTTPKEAKPISDYSGDIFFADYIQVTIDCTEIDDYIYPDAANRITGDGFEDRFDIWGDS